MIRLLLAFIAVAAAAPAVLAQTSAAGTTAANAQIVTGIGIARLQDLWFGDLLAPGTAGSVTVSIAGARTASGSIVTVGGTVSQAQFRVLENSNGSPKFWLQLPGSATITRSGGGASMTVSNFTSNVAASCTSTTGVQPAGPRGSCPNAQNFILNIGAQLNVAAGQMTGAYTGLFNVTVHRW